MNKLYPAIAAVLLLFASCVLVSAQDDDDEVYQVPLRQPAYVFDAYNPNDISAEDEKQKLKLFASRVKNTPDARGYIYIYRGLIDYKLDYQKWTANSSSYLNEISDNFYSSLAGFQNESSIELIVQPSNAEKLLPSSNISILNVKYYDDATLEKGTIQKTGRELLDNLIKRVETPLPAAARAVRASGEVAILTKIDEKGNVIEANALFGHPLLRAACVMSIKQWKFKPEILNKVPVKVVGIAICEFLTVENVELDY